MKTILKVGMQVFLLCLRLFVSAGKIETSFRLLLHAEKLQKWLIFGTDRAGLMKTVSRINIVLEP